MKIVLRWLAVPFVAVLGAFIGYWLVSLWIKGNNYGFQLYNGVEVGNITSIVIALAAHAIFGAVFVYCGALVAPMYKKTCAVVLASVCCTFSMISIIISLTQLDGLSFWFLPHILATMTGAISAAYIFEGKENNEITEKVA